MSRFPLSALAFGFVLFGAQQACAQSYSSEAIVRPPGSIPQIGRTSHAYQRDHDVTGSIPPSAPMEPAPAPVMSAPVTDGSTELPPELRRQMVNYGGTEAPGTIVIDTDHTQLYLVVQRGQAIRYGVGVGRDGFRWAGRQTITRTAQWPDWYPPSEMIERQPYLPRFMAGGPGNPLGARALYLGSSVYRIHGTNDPKTIGQFISSGCIRLLNEDISDLYARVGVGTPVVVLPSSRGVVS
jgi:lipoprotein-anchoring transpeptidase ErfK/SrfK